MRSEGVKLLESSRAVVREAQRSRLGPAAQALLAAALLVALKVAVHARGWEILDAGLPILTAALGAVVFTLAIVLAGVLADFKEAERGLGEIVSTVRRLHWDFALSGLDPAALAEVRGHLRHFVDMVLHNARAGERWRLRDLHGPIDAMDALLVRIRAPLPTTRTSEAGLAVLTRQVDRIETIVETTFMQPGYFFSACSITVVLACFALAPLGTAATGAILFGLVSFVLIGLYLLVQELDNPMAGSVRVSVAQVEKLAAFLRSREDGTAPVPVSVAARVDVPLQ